MSAGGWTGGSAGTRSTPRTAPAAARATARTHTRAAPDARRVASGPRRAITPGMATLVTFFRLARLEGPASVPGHGSIRADHNLTSRTTPLHDPIGWPDRYP